MAVARQSGGNSITDQYLLNLAADLILVTHFLFAVFLVLGLLLIYIGHFARWAWVRNPWFRILHLTGIGIVVLQSWLGVICPLTTWEMALREKAGAATYSGSFIQHWLHYLLYFDAPDWVFTGCYSLFGGLVLTSWFVVRAAPLARGRRRRRR